jgi:hypothetical protein
MNLVRDFIFVLSLFAVVNNQYLSINVYNVLSWEVDVQYPAKKSERDSLFSNL